MAFRLAIILGLWACSLGAVVKRTGKQPNIMWIFADDYGFNDIGYKDKMIKTPNMDALAGAGIKLNNAYVAAQCTPSRSSFMTGRYVYKMGMQHSVILDNRPQCIPLQYKLLPGYLKDLGYNTHAVGKWHLGMCREECTPMARGFDSFFGGFSGEGHYYDHTTFGGQYDWQDGNKTCWECKGTHSQDLVRKRVRDLLESEDGSAPWFMYVAFHNVHSEAMPKHKNMKQYEGLGLEHDRQAYLGLVSGMDDAIGAIVSKLKKTGHYDNTIIVFSADNGGDVHEANNAPLRGTKSTLWEGGCKGLAWIHSPLLSVGGVESDELVHVTDWLPTFVSLAGGDLDPKAAGMDGIDQSDLLLNNGPSKRNTMVYNIDREYEFGNPTYGEIAVRNEQYKLMWGSPGQVDGWGYEDCDFLFAKKEYTDLVKNYTAEVHAVDKRGGPYLLTSQQSSVMDSFFDMVQVSDDELESGTGYIKLFDLLNDPSEKKDLSASKDPKHVAAKKELIQLVRDSIADGYQAQTLQWNTPDPNFDPTFNKGALTPGFCKDTVPLPENWGTQ